jgi:hypothetical protein
VRSVQSIGDLRVETVSSATQQAKQQMVATFFNPTCRKLLPGQPCQVQYLFNTAIARRAVTDWSKVSWFQHGSVWFDPVQGGIPIVDGPIAAPGGLTTDGDAGLALFGSQGSATQHAAFNGRTFDVTISFDQLGNALRLITAKANKITLADVTDAQVDAMWGTSRSDRNAWVLLSADVGQEVYNPDALTKVQVAGGFTSLYVGPQP